MSDSPESDSRVTRAINAIRFAAILINVFLSVTFLLLPVPGGGGVLVFASTCAYWACFAFLAIRRWKALTGVDLIFLIFGQLLIAFALGGIYALLASRLDRVVFSIPQSVW